MLVRCRPLLGTFVEITVPEASATAVDGAFDRIGQIQRHMSFHDEGSDLGRLRRAAAGTIVEVAAETVEVLKIAVNLHRQTDGLFDVTVGRELVRSGFLPRPRGCRLRQQTGNASNIEIVDERHVRCHRPMLIDLGGIAKGYAVDQAVESLQSAGVERGLVNAGGDLRMFGDLPWDIALRDADGQVRQTVSLANCAVASSANRQNRRWRPGRWRTPHIGFGRRPVALDGRVTVVASHCVLADAMTKVAMSDRALAQTLLACQGGYVMDENSDRIAA